jgi:hypothetical protein
VTIALFGLGANIASGKFAFGLAALLRRLVSLFFRRALVLAVALHRDALLLIACLHRLSFSSASDTLFNLASDEFDFFMSG